MCGVTSKGFPRLTAKTFESSLTSDEVLVHFFNNFLSLPCFPDSVMYNQSSGLFEVVSGAAAVVSSRIRSALLLHKSRLLSDDHTAWSTSPKVDNQYTVHCLDKEEGIQWIKRERLPFFFKSDCYQEYRLSKYLLEQDWRQGTVWSTGKRMTKLCDICCQVSGPSLNDFQEFLKGKQGQKLIKLWIDIERLKAIHGGERKNRYLATMRISYLLKSSPTCLNMELLSRLGLTTSPCWTEEKLQSIQSCLTDSLLHYWVPRFLTSQCVRGSLPDSSVGLHTNCCHMSHSSTPSCHGSTTPPLLHTNTCWSQTSQSFHTQLQFIKDEELLCRAEKMLEALCVESRSGFYFTHFCEESGNQLWVNAVYFWTDLQHYHHLFFRDRRDPYRVQREAQLLCFTYISVSAKRSIGVNEELRAEVYGQVVPAFEQLFDGVEEHVLQILLEPWTLLVNNNQDSYQQVCVHEEVRHVNSQEFRELQNLYKGFPNFLQREPYLLEDSKTLSISSKARILSEAWSKVAPEYQGYRLGSLLRWRHDISHFMSFLRRHKACIHLRCWLDLEEYKRTPQRDDELRQKRSHHITAKYLNTKYFFGPDSPATAEQQENILQMTDGLEWLEYIYLSNELVVEIRDIIRAYIERVWLPLFLSSAEFIDRKKIKEKVKHWWRSSTKEIIKFRRVLLNPVTCELFQYFVSLKGNFLKKDVLFWVEVEKYKDLCASESDEATIQQKISVIISCFINSSVPPALQIDIPPEQAQDILDNRATLGPYVFREAQMSVFRELLKYWPEFKESISNMEEEQLLEQLKRKQLESRATLRQQRMKEKGKGDSRVKRRVESSSLRGTDQERAKNQSKELGELSWLFSKYMAGLKKEEMMLRKQKTGRVWRSMLASNSNPANSVITAPKAGRRMGATQAAVGGPAVSPMVKENPSNAPPWVVGERKAKQASSCVKRVHFMDSLMEESPPHPLCFPSGSGDSLSEARAGVLTENLPDL